MPQFGVQAATFVPGWDLSSARRALEAAARLGFNAVELPLLHPNALDSAAAHALRAVAQAARLRVICRTQLPPGCTLPRHAERARAFLGRAARAALALGAEALGGALLYVPGDFATAPAPGDAALLVEVLADLAHAVRDDGLLLALEPAHRFVTNWVTSTAQAVSLARATEAPNVVISLSTLQLHIGEASLAAAIHTAAPLLYSVSVAENTGGPPGSGAIQWPALWRALGEAHFDGLLLLDAPRAPEFAAQFTALIHTTGRMSADSELYPEEFAAQGLAFLQQGSGSPQPRPGGRIRD